MPMTAPVGDAWWVGIVLGLAFGSALLAACLILLLRPWLQRYAMARPSARGLHQVPTPQGGGIAVLAACMAAATAGAWILGLERADVWRLAAVLAAALVLAVAGLIDDVRPLPALPRLVLQLACMTVGVMALPQGSRVLPFLPLAAEQVALVIGGTWFINATNFMDGMDWMTVVEMVPVSAALVLLWSIGDLPPTPGLVALGLLGGLLGYAPFNKPVARLFLGDVGSLPIGFLIAYGLFSLAGQGRDADGTAALLAAVLLVFYYLADSGLTLMWRLSRRERVWEPHRSHFYQVAVARGFGTPDVLVRVGLANLCLVVFAFVVVAERSRSASVAGLAGAVVVVGGTLAALSRGRPDRSSIK